MNEKRFFRIALESGLLNGNSVKRRIDAQLAYENRTSFRTAAEPAPERQKHKGARTLPKWFTISATAAALALTLVIGVFIAINGGKHSGRSELASPTTEPAYETPGQIVTEQRTEVKLLPEIDPDGLVLQGRETGLSLPSYEEADWAWMRAIEARVMDLTATASTVQWTTELRIPKAGWTENPFETVIDARVIEVRTFFTAGGGLNTPDEGALLDFRSPGEVTFSEEGDDWVMRKPMVYAMPQVYDLWPGVLPPTGDVTVTARFRLLDREGTAKDMQQYVYDSGNMIECATVGEALETFSFDAEALLNLAEPLHTELKLSGEYVLGIHEESGFRNERVSLDGVTMDVEVHFTREGVYVILTIGDAGSLSEDEQEALYIALSGGPDGGDVHGNAFSEAGSVRVYRLMRSFWGNVYCGRYYLELDPSKYAEAKTVWFNPEAAYVIGAVGEEPDENWSWHSGDGTLPALMHDSKQLGRIEIPLPTIETDPLTGEPFVTETPKPLTAGDGTPQNEELFVPIADGPKP